MNTRIRNRIISVLMGIIAVWSLVTLVNWQGVMRRALLATAILSMPAGELSAVEGAVSGENLPEISYPTRGDENHESQAYNEGYYPTISFPKTSKGENFVLPDIPTEYLGTRIERDMAGNTTAGLITYKNAYIKNFTAMTGERIAQHLSVPSSISVKGSKDPEVLIVHTHATESYNPYLDGSYDKRYNWRSTDNTNNMVAVGAAMAAELRKAGITVIHDTTQHDYPTYNGSYTRSEKTVKDYLAKYPSIKVVLDLHRDAFEDEKKNVVAPVTEINGQSAAQVMIIACVDDGKLGIPNWQQNFRFAVALADSAERAYPGLMRPINVSYNRYNQHLSPGALLLEFGTHGCTLDEATYSATLVGEVLGELLLS